MEGVDHRSELGDLVAGRDGVGGMRREVRGGRIAPVVAHPPRTHRRLGHEGLHGEQFDRRHSQPHQVVDHRPVGESEIGAAQFRRHERVTGRVRTDVQFVDDGVLPRHAGFVVHGRQDGGHHRQRCVAERVGARHRTERVTLVRDQPVRITDVADDPAGPRVEQDLVRVGAQPPLRLPRPVGAVAVPLPGADAGDHPVPDPVGAVGQVHAVFVPVVVDETDLDAVAVRGVDGEACPTVDRGGAEREGGPVGERDRAGHDSRFGCGGRHGNRSCRVSGSGVREDGPRGTT